MWAYVWVTLACIFLGLNLNSRDILPGFQLSSYLGHFLNAVCSSRDQCTGLGIKSQVKGPVNHLNTVTFSKPLNGLVTFFSLTHKMIGKIKFRRLVVQSFDHGAKDFASLMDVINRCGCMIA